MTTWLLGIATLSLVMAGTPGPNNVMFAASGARVGYLRTIPALLGMLLGFALVVAAAASGIGALVAGNSHVQIVLSCVASAYMLWLAVRLWKISGGANADDDAPTAVLTWWQFAAFQFANPKTWLATVAFVSGFLGVNSPGGLAMDLVGAAWFLSVVALSASIWVLFGATLRARMCRAHWSRVNRGLALLAAATVASFWL